jgi:hypothetical protein
MARWPRRKTRLGMGKQRQMVGAEQELIAATDGAVAFWSARVDDMPTSVMIQVRRRMPREGVSQELRRLADTIDEAAAS